MDEMIRILWQRWEK